MSSSLKNALGRSGGKLAGVTSAPPDVVAQAEAVSVPSMPPAVRQPSRRDTAAITVHYPEPVRRQLKVLASEEGRNVDDMVAEALNLLFARYRKAEIAPRKASK